MRFSIFTPSAALLLASTAYAGGSVQVAGGTATFSVATNIPAVTIHGKSKALTANATVHHTNEALTIENVDAKLPVASLTTGMGLRDNHMRKLVFTAPEGQISDLVYRSGKTECAKPGENIGVPCHMKGELVIRGIPRPLTLALTLRSDSAGRYRVAGEGAVRLSDYGIEPPSQLGVRVEDKVQLRLEFMATASPAVSSARGQ